MTRPRWPLLPERPLIRLRLTHLVPTALAITLCLTALPLGAQARAVLRGNVLVDGTDAPVAGAEVSLPGLSLAARSDATGAFRLGGIPAGRHALVVRRVGFAPLSTMMTFAAGDSIEADLLLSASATSEGQPLPGVTVTAASVLRSRLAEFEERRALGAGGRFLTREQLDRMDGRRMSEAVAVIGVPVVVGTTNAAFVASSRGTQSFMRTTKPNRSDRARGAKPGLCYGAVALDGVLVYRGSEDGQGESEPLFDINALPPETIAGVEFYAGGATMPAKYNGTRSTCGLILIWTR